MHSPSNQSDSKSTRGFTLVELFVVLAIIGAIAAIAFPAYFAYVDKAKVTVAVATLDSARKNLEIYFNEHQEYPPPPIDFSTGMDSATPSRNVFDALLLQQINEDWASVDSYTRGASTYTLVIKAKDRNQTTITLTPNDLNY